MSAAWQDAFGPAEASVACGDQQHTIRWDGGRLLAPDHPDAEGELVMAALGGETSQCLELVEAWGVHSDNLDVLALGPRSPADEVSVSMPDEADDEHVALSHGHSGFFAYAPRTRAYTSSLFFSPQGAGSRAQRLASMLRWRTRVHPARSLPMIPAVLRGRGNSVSWGGSFAFAHGGVSGAPAADPAQARAARLVKLFALGTPFQLRLTAAVAAAWSQKAAGRDLVAAGPALTAALAGRLAPVAQAWLGIDPGEVAARPHDGAGWGELATASDGDQRRLTAALPAGWLAEVWAPGLALVDGHLVVALLEAAWPRATVLAVAEPGAEPVVRDVRHEVGRWHIAGEAARKPAGGTSEPSGGTQ